MLLAPRSALLVLLLIALPALAGPVASPLDVWADKVCPKRSPAQGDEAPTPDPTTREKCLQDALRKRQAIRGAPANHPVRPHDSGHRRVAWLHAPGER